MSGGAKKSIASTKNKNNNNQKKKMSGFLKYKRKFTINAREKATVKIQRERKGIFSYCVVSGSVRSKFS